LAGHFNLTSVRDKFTSEIAVLAYKTKILEETIKSTEDREDLCIFYERELIVQLVVLRYFKLTIPSLFF